jgi:signal transduction histidine kinase
MAGLMREWWHRVPKDTRVAAALAVLVLLQTVALAAFGLAAARSQRAEAEQGLRTLASLALSRGLAEPAADAISRVEAEVAAACARGAAPEAAAAPIQPAVFSAGFALLPDGSVVDARGVTLVPPRAPSGPEDAALRRRVEALEAAAGRDPGRARDAAREAVEAAAATEDPVAGCRALRFASRAALGAGEDSLALRACERLLDRWPDTWVEGEYPFGPGAAAAACEVWRRRLEARAPGAAAAFVEAALAWRRALVRAPLEPSTAAAEAAEVRKLAEGAAGSLGEADRQTLEEGLIVLDRADRAADAVRSAPVRTALRDAAAAGRPTWINPAGPDGAPITFCVAPAAGGAAVAFRTDPSTLRAVLILPLARTLSVHEGVEVRLLTPDRRPLDGREEAPPPRSTLASQTLRLPAGPILVEAILADPQVLESEAARSRNLLVGVFAAAAAALGLGSLLVLRMVRSEVRLAKMKADFVSAVSHDLKTPLTSIRMFVETLREGRARTEEERRECLDVVDREAGRLERMVNRVLEFSRIEGGARKVRLEPADPTAVAREAAQVFRGRILEGACDFRVEEAAGVPSVPLDRDAVTQALLELLENAHKHNPAEGRRILLRVAPGPAAGVRYEVEDNGPGVPPAEREAVFREFHRVERPGLEAVGGTGLGLALVRRLVEAHGGTVRIAEGAGGGSLLAVEIPGASERTV